MISESCHIIRLALLMQSHTGFQTYYVYVVTPHFHDCMNLQSGRDKRAKIAVSLKQLLINRSIL